MLHSQHALTNSQHRSILLLRLGKLALGIQRIGQIVPAKQGVGVFYSQYPLLCGEQRPLLVLRLDIPALCFHCAGQIVTDH